LSKASLTLTLSSLGANIKKEKRDEYRVSLVELPPIKPRFSRRQSPAALVSDERT